MTIPQLQRLLWDMLEKKACVLWSLIRMCENPDCPTPYFLEARKGQKYCSHKCAVLINVRRFRARREEEAEDPTEITEELNVPKW